MTLSPLFLALAAGLSPGPGPAPEPLKVLDAVVVVGSRSAEPLRQVVGTTSRVDREQLELRGVQTLDDLARLVPGMEVASDPNRFGALGFNLRGLEGNRVSVELDGIPLADGFGVGQFALAGRDLVELGIVERVEVLRGPASTLHGSKALAGVVAYWTPDPAEAEWRDEEDNVQGSARAGAGSRDHGRWLSGRLLARSARAMCSGSLTMITRCRRWSCSKRRVSTRFSNVVRERDSIRIADSGMSRRNAYRRATCDSEKRAFAPPRTAIARSMLRWRAASDFRLAR